MFIAVPLSSVAFILFFAEVVLPCILVIMLIGNWIKWGFKMLTNKEYEASELKKYGISLPDRLKKYEDK